MKFRIKESLALKLSLYIIAAVVIIFMAVQIYNYYVSKKLILENNNENITNLQNSILNDIDNLLLPASKAAESLASALSYANLSANEIEQLIHETLVNNSEINGCTVAFAPYKFEKDKYYYDPYYHRVKGKIERFGLDNDDEYDYFRWDWYKAPMEAGKGVWSEPYFDEGSGNIMMVTYSQPFYHMVNDKKEFYGVVACDIALDSLEVLISKIKVFTSGYAFLLSSKGIFIAHRNKKYYEERLSFNDLAKKYNSPIERTIGENMIAGKSGNIEYYSDTLHKNCYVCYQPLATTGWSIGIVIPKNELYSKLDSITRELFLIGLIGYVLTLILIIVLSSRATTPLRNLANATYKIGQGDFDFTIPEVKSHDEIGTLSSSFISMQDNLIKYVNNLQKTTAEKEKIEKELSIAREIQESIIPTNFPERKEFDLYAMLVPAREVGGDLYDFFFIDDTHLCFAIGDVSGKGVPAALFMAITKTLLRAKMSLFANPSDVISAMNKELCKESESAMFVTFFICILNIKTGDMNYCNAGHNPPLVHKAGQGFSYLYIDDPSPPIGVLEDTVYATHKLKLFPEDIFCLYTDGITEAMTKDNIQFSEEKLLEIMTQNKDESVADIVNNIKFAVVEHASGADQSDDITMLVLKYNG